MIAAALVLVSPIAVTPALAQTNCISGFVWYDANNNGIQDIGETGIQGAIVTTTVGESDSSVVTDQFGRYEICGVLGDVQVWVTFPEGFDVASPANSLLTDDSHDSDGVDIVTSEGQPSVVYSDVVTAPNSTTDFGFWHPAVAQQPGTGTPGYWKNHPEAWPANIVQNGIVVGGRLYTQAQAIALLSDPGSDKSLTMFSSLVPAMLNVIIGNNSSCVDQTIIAANTWMGTPPPAGAGYAGSKVKASSLAWKNGEPLHRILDNYNNGMLCAPHRD